MYAPKGIMLGIAPARPSDLPSAPRSGRARGVRASLLGFPIWPGADEVADPDAGRSAAVRHPQFYISWLAARVSNSHGRTG